MSEATRILTAIEKGDPKAAEEQEPVVRKVALKVIKPGMDTKQVLARFEAERQALALIAHLDPAVSRIDSLPPIR